MVSRTKAASRIDHSRVATPSARQAPAISSKRPVGIARPPGRPAAEIIAFVSLTWISLLIPDTMKITAMNRRPKKTAIMDMGYRSEEHTSELQSLMRISYAVFCLKKKKEQNKTTQSITHD